MKIFKLAAGKGKRTVQITLDMESGSAAYHILGHSEGSSCSDGLDQTLIDMLAEGEDKLDSGLTAEGLEEATKHLSRVQAPTAKTPQKEKSKGLRTLEDLDPQSTQRSLDKGFGV
jgi:hypothetical protein